MTALSLARTLWLVTVLAGAALVAGFAASVGPVPPPRLGVRARARQRALEASSAFAIGEPLIRRIAGWLLALGFDFRGGPLERALGRAGTWLGLSPVEWVALAGVLSVVGGAAGGVITVGACGSCTPGLVLGATFGALVPWLRLSEREKQRGRDATRTLPATIDLMSLCMSAGIDFPGAIEFVVGDEENRDTLRSELALVLAELELGHTRIRALRALELRLPCDAIRLFVGAVAQAEERGNPVAEVLRTQATVLRNQRGVRAEEAASRASVLMVLPLMLLLACILLLLFAPFVLGGALR